VTLDACAKPSIKKRRHHDRKHSNADSNEDPSTTNDAGETTPLGRPRGFKVITQYRPNLFVGYIGAKELVIVERPLVDILATLPPAYFRHKYGES
jgi:U3 small nucleolar RNA-associated protein 4